jgi:hypothetical protein
MSVSLELILAPHFLVALASTRWDLSIALVVTRDIIYQATRAVCRASQGIIVLVPTLSHLPVPQDRFPQRVHPLVPLAQQDHIHFRLPQLALLALPADFACKRPHRHWDQGPALRDLFRLWAVARLQLARPALQGSIAFWAAPVPLATGPVLLVRTPSKEQA